MAADARRELHLPAGGGPQQKPSKKQQKLPQPSQGFGSELWPVARRQRRCTNRLQSIKTPPRSFRDAETLRTPITLRTPSHIIMTHSLLKSVSSCHGQVQVPNALFGRPREASLTATSATRADAARRHGRHDSRLEPFQIHLGLKHGRERLRLNSAALLLGLWGMAVALVFLDSRVGRSLRV